MKYLVNRETKEHIVFHADLSVPYPQWSIVEADSEGWITWEGGECPLPDGSKYDIKFASGLNMIELTTPEELFWADGTGITAYRPILETAEKAAVKESFTTESVFYRLKSAIAASESIPAIIAEIDALLPEGYCVAKRSTVNEAHIEGIGGITLTSQTANDMSDWRNWRAGDLVTAHGLRGGYTENAFPENVPHTIVAKCLSGFNVKSSNGDVLYFNCREISRGELKFHSHPSKVAE